MDIYHIWFNLKPGVRDTAFTEALAGYMDHLRSLGAVESHRLMRRKLGLAPPGLDEFHLMIETRDMAQLETAFSHVASRAEPAEAAHHGVNRLVAGVSFGLYRDFPDEHRTYGEERF